MSEGQPADAERAAVLTGTRPWSSREVPLVADTPEQLAARVDAATDRADRVLFTITPREELEGAARWQRLADEAWCGQLRHVVASTVRMNGSDRDFAGDELALALGLSPMTGRSMVWEYGAIASLPGLVEAVEQGRLTSRHVTAFMRALDEVSLSLEQRQAVALIALARHVDQTPGEWADLVRRLVLTVDRQAAARRRSERTAERRARFYPQPDEQGAMWLQAPVEQVARVEARLSAEARRLKAAGDPRTMDQLVCDVAIALLADGTLDGQSAAPYEVHVVTPLSALTDDPVDAPVDAPVDPPVDPPAACDPAAAAEALPSLSGWGPVSAGTAREIAQQAAGFTQITVEGDGLVVGAGDRVRADRVPAERLQQPGPRLDLTEPDRFLARAAAAMTRPVVDRDLSTTRYRPGARLSRLVRARDRTCVFPGCRRPASRADLDHRVPWPRGRTSDDNLQCLCGHHHRAKHAVFTVLLDDDGSTLWISRSGWVFRRRPQGR